MSAVRVGVRKERLGRYTLLERIASGGMAEIFLASSEGARSSRKLVAIKRILPENARNTQFVTMFLNEARIAATLHHPNVVEAYDFGGENGAYYLAMEYLRGQDARRIVQTLARAGQQLPLEIAIASALGIATGLHYVHERRDAGGRALGLVHRDVSPQNIFLTSAGAVKLVDFGVAKAVHRVSDTLAGTIKGKITYMSPEQISAQPLDRRSDIFSLSISLWELTVGRRLFESVSEAMVTDAITKLDAPKPSQMVAGYPSELERIVMKGLARDRNLRYQTAEEMRIDLERFARELNLDVTPRRISSFVRSLTGDSEPADAVLAPGPTAIRSLRRVVWFVALGLLVGAGVGLGAAWLGRQHRSVGASPPGAAPVPNSAPSSVPAEKPPAAIEEPPAEPVPAAAPRARRDVAPPADLHRKRDGARKQRPSQPPPSSPPVEKWSPDPEPPPPPPPP